MYKIDPLNGENYITWHRWLEWILDDSDLWMVTNRSETEPVPVDARAPTQVERTAINEWKKKKDKRARKEICLRVSDEYLVYIDHNTTAAKLWTRLQGIFESRAAIGIVNIRQEFFWTIAVDGVNMDEHVRKL